MATGSIPNDEGELRIVGNLGYTSIYDYVRSSDCPEGISFRQIQNSSDNPLGSGRVAQIMVNKPLSNGDYAIVTCMGSGAIYESGQLSPSATSFDWYLLQRNITNMAYPRLYVNASSITSYTFEDIKRNSPNDFAFFLMFGGTAFNSGFLFLGHVNTNGNGNVVTLISIKNDTGRTFSGTYNQSTGVLSIDVSSTLYGGIRLIWMA